MEKKNKVYKIIYLLLCFIIISVVAILCISNTQAYFAAREENTGEDIEGDTLDIELELTANSISTSATGNLIPLDKDIESLTKAAKGYGNNTSTFDNTKSCLDINGYSVCKVYEIKVTNKSDGPATINGGVTSLYGDRTPHVACAVMDDSTNVSNNDTCVDNDTIAKNVTLNSRETYTKYIIVYIENINEPQYDVGLFEGVVKVETQAGVKIIEIN